jgi:hypothetical protein
MGRWDDDDARGAGGGDSASGGRTQGGRDEVAADIRALPERVPSRARDGADEAREHSLTLPAGRTREPVRDEARLYHLRGSEVDLLEQVARYRAVFVEDAQHDTGDLSRAHTDLASLERQGLVETHTVTRLRDGTVADVVHATGAGKALLDHARDPGRDVGQVYHAGWVKPAEVWHDARLFRMVRQAEAELVRSGEHVRRVVLDDELKARAYEALHEAKSRGNSAHAAQRAVARAQDLHLDDGHFVFPDVRLEIEGVNGEVRHADLELVTEHYHRGHLGGKAAAGFRMYGGKGSSSRGGTPHDPRVVGRLVR